MDWMNQNPANSLMQLMQWVQANLPAPQQFDPEGSGYDEVLANELRTMWPLTTPKPSKYEGEVVRNEESFDAWVWHPELDEYVKHGASRDPRTGRILKGRKSETYHLTEAREKEMGGIIYRGKDGYYYSQKKMSERKKDK